MLQTNSRFNSQTTRQQSEDMIHKQLAAFERLLLHSMSRFLKEQLYHMLRHVTRWAQEEEAKNSNGVIITPFKLKSIHQLKEHVISMKEKRTHKAIEEDHIFKYYDLFLNDLLYLKDLKKYFDDEIYRSLMKYHYDPSIGKNKVRDGLKCNQSKSNTKRKGRYVSHAADEDDSGNGSQIDSGDNNKPPGRVSQRKKGKPAGQYKTVSADAEKQYRDTVCELQDILQKWNGLLSENVLDLNDFDPDSYHELMQFTNYSQFEPVLRLVPDIFAKCYKCIDLAKVWLRESNIVLKDIPLPEPSSNVTDENKLENKSYAEQQTATREFIKQVREIKSQLGEIDKSIEDDERKLQQYKREMSQLSGRDERFSKLTSEFNKMDSMLTLAAGDYQKSKTEQYAVASKLRGCAKDSYDYAELKDKLKKVDKEVSENHWKMKLLEFEKTTVEEDYMVESGVRPSFIRFIGDTKEKMHELQEGLHAKKEEKLKLDKQLALMKTNTDRMKKIMRTYLGSAETRVGRPMDRESTMSSHQSDADMDDLSEYFLEDGNEADVDSAGPYDNSPGRYEAVEETPVDVQTNTANRSVERVDSAGFYHNSPGRYEAVIGTQVSVKTNAKPSANKQIEKETEMPNWHINRTGRYETVRPISVGVTGKDEIEVRNTQKDKPRPTSFRSDTFKLTKGSNENNNLNNEDSSKRSNKRTVKSRRVWENT